MTFLIPKRFVSVPDFKFGPPRIRFEIVCILKTCKKAAVVNVNLNTKKSSTELTFSSVGTADWSSETVAG